MSEEVLQLVSWFQFKEAFYQAIRTEAFYSSYSISVERLTPLFKRYGEACFAQLHEDDRTFAYHLLQPNLGASAIHSEDIFVFLVSKLSFFERYQLLGTMIDRGVGERGLNCNEILFRALSQAVGRDLEQILIEEAAVTQYVQDIGALPTRTRYAFLRSFFSKENTPNFCFYIAPHNTVSQARFAFLARSLSQEGGIDGDVLAALRGWKSIETQVDDRFWACVNLALQQQAWDILKSLISRYFIPLGSAGRGKLLDDLLTSGAAIEQMCGVVGESIQEHARDYMSFPFSERAELMERYPALFGSLSVVVSRESDVREMLRYGLEHGHLHVVRQGLAQVIAKGDFAFFEHAYAQYPDVLEQALRGPLDLGTPEGLVGCLVLVAQTKHLQDAKILSGLKQSLAACMRKQLEIIAENSVYMSAVAVRGIVPFLFRVYRHVSVDDGIPYVPLPVLGWALAWESSLDSQSAAYPLVEELFLLGADTAGLEHHPEIQALMAASHSVCCPREDEQKWRVDAVFNSLPSLPEAIQGIVALSDQASMDEGARMVEMEWLLGGLFVQANLPRREEYLETFRKNRRDKRRLEESEQKSEQYQQENTKRMADDALRAILPENNDLRELCDRASGYLKYLDKCGFSTGSGELRASAAEIKAVLVEMLQQAEALMADHKPVDAQMIEKLLQSLQELTSGGVRALEKLRVELTQQFARQVLEAIVPDVDRPAVLRENAQRYLVALDCGLVRGMRAVRGALQTIIQETAYCEASYYRHSKAPARQAPQESKQTEKAAGSPAQKMETEIIATWLKPLQALLQYALPAEELRERASTLLRVLEGTPESKMPGSLRRLAENTRQALLKEGKEYSVQEVRDFLYTVIDRAYYDTDHVFVAGMFGRPPVDAEAAPPAANVCYV